MSIEKLKKSHAKETIKKFTSFYLGFEKTVELLIQKGADLNVVGQHGYTPLMHSANQGANQGKIRPIHTSQITCVLNSLSSIQLYSQDLKKLSKCSLIKVHV